MVSISLQTSHFLHASFSYFHLVVFSCSSLNFLKRIILNSLSWQFIHLHFSRVSYWNFRVSFSSVILTWFFCGSWFFMLLSAYLSNGGTLPDFTDLLWKIQLLHNQLILAFWMWLVVKSLGRWGLLLWSVWGQENCLSPKDKAENSLIWLLAWFPTQGKLSDRLHGFLDSLVRLNKWSGLDIIVSNRWTMN